MELTPTEQSILRLDNLFFNQFSFKNSGVRQNNTPSKKGPKMTVSVSVSPDDNTGFTVILALKIRCGNIYQLSCSLTGAFKVEGGLSDENVFLQDNAVAIMFPYMRSQITLLTSQPGIEPIIIPALNIKKILHPED